MAGGQGGTAGWIGVALAAAIAGALAGGAGSMLRGPSGDGGAEAGAARATAERAEAAAGEARERADAAAASARRAEESAAALAARVAALEAAPRGGAPPAGAAPGGPAAGGAPSGGEGDRLDPALAAEFDTLRRKFFRGQSTPDEQKRYFEILKSPGFIEGLLADLEGKVAAAPGDHEARMTLADAYISKLFTVPPGPEMGIWGEKAEGQWKEVLKQDDRHWQARFNLAFSWSQYPEFLNKTPDSIREFEKLRTQQEQGAVEPRHAQVYFHLHTLYRKAGNAEKSREALEEGLRRFPDDAELKKVQGTLGR